MAKLYGKQSQYLIKGEQKNIFMIILAASLLLVLLVFWILFSLEYFSSFSNANKLVFSLSVSAVALFIGFKNKHFMKAIDNFYHGRSGEGAVWYTLKELPDEYIVFQDIKDNRLGNIDFAVVGPTGIFAIEVKSMGGFIRSSKYLSQALKQTRREAAVLKDLIKEKIGIDIWVEPVLVYSNKLARVRFGLHQIEKVYVVQKRWLNKVIYSNSSKPALTPEQIKKIEAVLGAGKVIQ